MFRVGESHAFWKQWQRMVDPSSLNHFSIGLIALMICHVSIAQYKLVFLTIKLYTRILRTIIVLKLIAFWLFNVEWNFIKKLCKIFVSWRCCLHVLQVRTLCVSSKQILNILLCLKLWKVHNFGAKKKTKIRHFCFSCVWMKWFQHNTRTLCVYNEKRQVQRSCIIVDIM